MAGEIKITDETLATSSELATVLGLSIRRIQQLAQDGKFQSVSKGRYPLADSIQRYIKFLSLDTVDEETQKLDRARRVSETTIKTSKATIAKLEADELKGKMHRSEDVAAMTEDLIYTIRGALIALPGRLAMDAAAAKTAPEAAEVIRKEVHTIMRELAAYRYDPQKYQERVRNRMSWETSGDDDDGE